MGVPVNTDSNEKLQYLRVAPVGKQDARKMVLRHHYMRTWPAGARLCLGVFYRSRCVGILVFGYSSATDAKVANLVPDLQRENYLEMQRMWISDSMGHNTESKALSLAMRSIKKHYPQMRLVYTHAGGCKNDCGIVYQSSAWLYFGRSECNDFYLTAAGEYKNIIAEMRFGRVDPKGKTRQEVAREAFGEGELIDSWRYAYVYPIDRGLRRRLSKQAMPYPKESAHFRYQQEFVT